MKKFTTILFSINILINFSFSQTYTLKIWPNGVPGSIPDSNYKETTEFVLNSPRILQVSDPEIYVFLPQKEKATGAAVIICPGGAYHRLALDPEGYDVAKWFIEMGIAGIVVKYRLPSDKIMLDKSIGPLQDIQEAIRIVRRYSGKWNISTNKIGVMGFSAGGHLAASASTMYAQKVYTPEDTVSARPNFSLLIYGVISMQEEITHIGSMKNLLGENPTKDLQNKFSNELHVDEKTPMAFIVHSADDQVVSVLNSTRYFHSLVKNHIPAEIHVFETGGHGYGMAHGRKSTESSWPDLCKKWLFQHNLINQK